MVARLPGGRRLGLLLALLLLPATLQASPQGPLPGGGRVDLGGGLRYLPGSPGAGLTGRFGWQADERWLVALDLGFGVFWRTPQLGEVRVTVLKAQLATTYQLLVSGPLLPYLTLGTGYALVGALADGTYREQGAPLFHLGAGLYLPLAGRFGLLLEDRFELASTVVEVRGSPEAIAGGGNLLWLGLVLTFPPEPDRSLSL